MQINFSLLRRASVFLIDEDTDHERFVKVQRSLRDRLRCYQETLQMEGKERDKRVGLSHQFFFNAVEEPAKRTSVVVVIPSVNRRASCEEQ